MLPLSRSGLHRLQNPFSNQLVSLVLYSCILARTQSSRHSLVQAHLVSLNCLNVNCCQVQLNDKSNALCMTLSCEAAPDNHLVEMLFIKFETCITWRYSGPIIPESALSLFSYSCLLLNVAVLFTQTHARPVLSIPYIPGLDTSRNTMHHWTHLLLRINIIIANHKF